MERVTDMKIHGGTALVLGFGAALILTGLSCGTNDRTEGTAAAASTAPGGSGSPGGGAVSPGSPVSTSPTTSAAVTFDPRTPSIGMNLNGVSYYSPQWAFVDAMKMSRVNSGEFPWDLKAAGLPAPALDEQGYPIGLGAGQVVSTLMLRAIGDHFPAGEYIVLFDGDGEVKVSLDGNRESLDHDGAGSGRFTVDVTPTSNGLMLEIKRSNPANHVRNVRVIMPGFEVTYATRPFHPLFLERLRPFSALRFMDWGNTNGSTVTRWDERKRPDYRSQHGGAGVAHELMVQLCNQTLKQPWICVPHHADDDYVRSLATLLRDGVDPRLKVFIEYSNEVWNGSFKQHRDVTHQARRERVEWYACYTRRSCEIFSIFEEVFGGTTRLVRVLGSQAGNPWIAKQICRALPSPGAADALAIAPYFGGRLGAPKHWRTTRDWTVEQVLDACQAELAEQRDLLAKTRARARDAGLALIAYEGGQHLAAVGEAVNDEKLVDLFIEANRHPRMRQLYREALAVWAAEGGGTFVHFNDVFVPQKWGNWGALEYQDSDPAGSPKYSALVSVAEEWARSTPPGAGP